MKYSMILTGMAAAASAQSSITSLVAQIPTCALSCFITNVPAVCANGITDYGCQCANQEKLSSTITPCVDDACSEDEAQMVLSLSNQICDTYNEENGGASSSSSAAASSSMAATSSASAAASSASSMASTMTMTDSEDADATTTGLSAGGVLTSAASAAASDIDDLGNGAPMATAAPVLAAALGALAFAL